MRKNKGSALRRARRRYRAKAERSVTQPKCQKCGGRTFRLVVKNPRVRGHSLLTLK